MAQTCFEQNKDIIINEAGIALDLSEAQKDDAVKNKFDQLKKGI